MSISHNCDQRNLSSFRVFGTVLMVLCVHARKCCSQKDVGQENTHERWEERSAGDLIFCTPCSQGHTHKRRKCSLEIRRKIKRITQSTFFAHATSWQRGTERKTHKDGVYQKEKKRREKKNREKCVAKLANFLLNVFTARHEKQKEKKRQGWDCSAEIRRKTKVCHIKHLPLSLNVFLNET